jgi:hypothetical protein
MIKSLQPPYKIVEPGHTAMEKSLSRTFLRIDKSLRAEHKRLGLPLVVWKDGRVQKIKP